MFKAINRFFKIDKDSSLAAIENTSVRDSVNMSLTEDGNIRSATTMKGTLLQNQFVVPGDNWKVLASIQAYGNFDLTCSGTYEKRRGVVFITYDDFVGSSVWFYDLGENQSYRLFPDAVNALENELGFNQNSVIDLEFISDNDKHFVYFTDGQNIFRRIEVKFAGSSCHTFPLIKELSVRPVDPIDCLIYSGQGTNGSLNSGTYQFAYRRWNSNTCVYSAWSNITNPIPVIPDLEGCTTTNGRRIWGGRVGVPTNKTIKLSIPTSLGAAGFDQVQLLVIENVAGIKTDAATGKIFDPNVYDAVNGIEFTGLEEGISIDLSDVVIDDMPIIGAGTITEKDNKMFLGNIKVQTFEMDNGSPVDIDDAFTIQTTVGVAGQNNAYKCEEDTVNKKGHFRDEVYAYGLLIKDEFGNGIVCPFDFSNFRYNEVKTAAVTNGTVDSQTGNSFLLNVGDSSLFTFGDLIALAGVEALVSEIVNGTQIRVVGDLMVGSNGSVDILIGQAGNQGTSWAWKYPSRSSNQFTILDENNEVKALGLKIEGIKNFPSWAKSFEIVRRKRIKNIVYQTPHIPGIAIEGAATMGQPQYALDGSTGVGWAFDYKGELDYVCPKVHSLGTARNIARKQFTFFNATAPSEYTEWETQNNVIGKNEVASIIFALPPEYVMNHNGGEAFRLDDATGNTVEIVDAVSLLGSIESELIAERVNESNKRISTFKALNRDQYFYNREGRIVENNADVFFKKINELDGFGNYEVAQERKVDYQVPIALDSTKVTLPRRAFNSPNLSTVEVYGAGGELSAQQGSSQEIPGRMGELFWPVVKNQRGIVMKLDGVLEDFSRMMVQRRIDNNDDYFPLDTWTANPNVYGEDHLTSDNFQINGVPVRSKNDTVWEPLLSNHIHGGAYILNIKKGYGDDRYGKIEEIGGEWIRTGVCKELTAANIANNDSFDVEVYGGDCFISQQVLKVSDSIPRVVEYDPINALVGTNGNDDSFDVDEWSKTGAWERNVEILELFLESEVNGAYAGIIDTYPNLSAGDGGAGDWENYYHPNYSNQNTNKVFASKQNFCKLPSQLRNTVMWSDTRVRGGSSNPFVDIEGFNRYRVNNLWVLDAKYGDITKIDTLDDKALHIFQDKKIAFQPIGVDEIRTIDGAIIATGSGSVLGSGDYYLQADVGSQHLRTIQSRDGKFYAVDANRKVVYSFGSRGAGFELISEQGMISFFRDYFTDTLQLNQLVGHIDERYNRYILHRVTTALAEDSPVWNIKTGSWETRFDTLPFQMGISEDDRLFWFYQGAVHEMYEGPEKTFFGEEKESLLTFIVNYDESLSKVFRVLIINSRNRADTASCIVYNENELLPHQATAKIDINKSPRNEQYFVNELVSVHNGRSRRLRGKLMQVTLGFSDTTRQTVVYNVVCELIKSY